MNSVGRTASKNWLSLVLIFLFTFSISFAGGRFVRSILVGNRGNEQPQSDGAGNDAQDFAQNSDAKSAAPVDLQPIIDAWATELTGQVGIVVYDLDLDKVAASHNPDKAFLTNNLRDLILAYDGYRQIDAGVEDPNIGVINATTYGECLETMIRTNDTICSEAILFDQNRSAKVKDFLSALDMNQTTDFGQSSTANDYAKFLRHAYAHRDLTLENWAKFQDFMLEPSSENAVDWRKSLPSGFSTAKVYAKASGALDTGAWERYADLALVDFVKQNRHFAIVILSEGVADVGYFSRLGTLIEGKVIEE